MADLTARLRAAVPAVFAEPPVAFAYLFGSHATGRAGPRSDIDIAVMLADEVPSARYLNLALRFAGALQSTPPMPIPPTTMGSRRWPS